MKIRKGLIAQYESKIESLKTQHFRILGAIEVLEKLIVEEQNPQTKEDKK